MPPTPPSEPTTTAASTNAVKPGDPAASSSKMTAAIAPHPSTTANAVAANAVAANGTSTPTISSSSPDSLQHVWFITGPAGSGKTSVAEFLHRTFQFPYLEGDSFHTPANVAKMASGHPLTDADRWDWLITLREQAVLALTSASAESSSTIISSSSSSPAPAKPAAVIVTCSALRTRYRDVLRIASCTHPSIRVHFLFLRVSEEELLNRVRARQNHYMKDSMVKSQVQQLEMPDQGEVERDVEMVEAVAKNEIVCRRAEEVVRRIMET